jgi:hypothetical protein
MKKNVWNGIVLLAAVMAVLALAGCPTEAGSLSSDATVSSVTVGGSRAFTLGTPNQDWQKALEKPGHVYVAGSKLERAEVSVATAEGATVFLAQAKPSVQPYFESRKSFDFDPDDYLFVEVFSANHDAFLIYAIIIHNRNPGLSTMTLAGRSLTGGQSAAGQPIPKFGDLGKPGTSWNDPAIVEGEAWYGADQEGFSLPVELMPEISNVTVRTAVAANGTIAPEFPLQSYTPVNGAITGITIQGSNNTYLYVEIQGDHFSEPTYYKLKLIQRNNSRVLTSAKFVLYDGSTKLGEYPVGIGTMGTSSWSGSEAYGNYENGAEIVGGNGSTQTVDRASTSILKAYNDTAEAWGTGTNTGGLQPWTGLTGRPPANLKVVLEIEGDGLASKKFTIEKNQRASPSFDNTTGDFGNLVGFWWWGVEVESGIGEKGWYKFATCIGSENADIGEVKVNGVSVDFTGITGNATAAELIPDTNFATVTLPAGTNLATLSIEASPAAGYHSLVSMAMAPDAVTNVPQVTFNINQDECFNRATRKNTSTLQLEPGNFIYIRVLAEISWLYGGSGFVSATWNPARTAPVNYTAYRYYKIQVLTAQGSNGADITDIKYKGTAMSLVAPPVPVTVATTTTTAYSQDSKKNTIATTTVTTTWGAEINNLDVDNYADASFDVVAASNSPNIKVAYAQPTSAASGVTEWFSKEKFEQLYLVSSNTYLMLRVTSESGAVIKYYRFYIKSTQGNDTAITSIKVNTSTDPFDNSTYWTGGYTQPANWAGNTAATGTVVHRAYITKNAFARVDFEVAKPNPDAEVAYALAAGAATAPAAGDYQLAAADGKFSLDNVSIAQYVVIRVISADRTATAYYKVWVVLVNAGTDATITALRIGHPGSMVAATLPDPVTAANTAPGGAGATLTYYVPGASLSAALNNLQIEVTKTDANATVSYVMAAANNTSVTDFSNTSGLFPTWQNAQWLYVRVMAENNVTANFYKIRIAYGQTGASLTDILINGTSITTEVAATDPLTYVAIPAPNAAVTGTTAAEYHVAAAANLTNLTASVVGSSGASVAYAMAAASNTNTTDFSNTTGSFAAFTQNNYLVIRVTSEDTITTQYYKVRILVGSKQAYLTGISVNSVPLDISNYTPNTAVTGPNFIKYRHPVDQPFSQAAVTITNPGNATVTYAVAPTSTTNTPAGNFNTTSTFPGLISNQVIVLRSVSSDGLTTYYYKVLVVHGSSEIDLINVRVNGNSLPVLPTMNATLQGSNYTVVQPANLSSVTVRVGVAGGVDVAYYHSTSLSPISLGTEDYDGIFTGLSDGDYVILVLTAEDRETVEYYKLRMVMNVSNAVLTGIAINGTDVSSLPAVNTAVTGINAVTESGVNFTSDVVVTVAGVSMEASVAYGIAPDNSTSPADFSNTTGIFTGLSGGEYVVIRVTSYDASTINYYKVELQP